MLKYNRFASLNLENQIYQGFQTPAGPINLKPLQGLKRWVLSLRDCSRSGPINLKPLQGLKLRICRGNRGGPQWPNQPQTLTGIETCNCEGDKYAVGTRPNQPQTLTGIETFTGRCSRLAGGGPINLKPLQGLKHLIYSGLNTPISAQSTSNPYRD